MMLATSRRVGGAVLLGVKAKCSKQTAVPQTNKLPNLLRTPAERFVFVVVANRLPPNENVRQTSNIDQLEILRLIGVYCSMTTPKA